MHMGPANANGHRRRQVRSRVLAEETYCALCGERVDKTLGMQRDVHGPKCRDQECAGCVPHPRRPEVDEDIPRSRGGSPLDRANTVLMHRACNGWKGKLTLAEAKARRAGTHHAPRETVLTNLVAW